MNRGIHSDKIKIFVDKLIDIIYSYKLLRLVNVNIILRF